MNRREIVAAALAALASPVLAEQNASLKAKAIDVAQRDQLCSLSVGLIKSAEAAEAFSVSGCGGSDPDKRIFQAASLSKPVVAYLALQIVQTGQLSLNVPISEYLPTGYHHRQNIFALHAPPIVDEVPKEILASITIRELLQHTAGFPNWSPHGPLLLQSAPGAHWQYSGEGYVLLQRVLETATAMPLQNLAQDKVFAPLKLLDTSFKLNDVITPHLVAGQPRQLRFPDEIASTSLYTTAADYAAFVAHLLKDQTILAQILERPAAVPSGWQDLWRTSPLAWGLGWGVELGKPKPVLWHWGDNPGFRSFAMADTGSGDGIIVLTASDRGMSAAKDLVQAQLQGDHPSLAFSMVN